MKSLRCFSMLCLCLACLPAADSKASLAIDKLLDKHASEHRLDLYSVKSFDPETLTIALDDIWKFNHHTEAAHLEFDLIGRQVNMSTASIALLWQQSPTDYAATIQAALTQAGQPAIQVAAIEDSTSNQWRLLITSNAPLHGK